MDISPQISQLESGRTERLRFLAYSQNLRYISTVDSKNQVDQSTSRKWNSKGETHNIRRNEHHSGCYGNQTFRKD